MPKELMFYLQAGTIGSVLLSSLTIVSLFSTPALSQDPINRPTVTPAPEQQSVPEVKIQLTNDRVNVMLKNNTNATIVYQAVGDTEPRTLAKQSSIVLRSLKTPVTLTLDRQDSGLLKVTPQASIKTDGMLEVTLNTTTDLSADATTLRIEQTGSVFLY